MKKVAEKGNLIQQMIAARATEKVAVVKDVVGIVKKSGENYGRIYSVKILGDKWLDGTFKFLEFEMENLIPISGSHKEKGDYLEFFTPDGVRVLGTRVYEATDDCCSSQ